MQVEVKYKGRVSGLDFKRLLDAKSIIKLNNVERFVLALSKTAVHSNSVITAAATRWCSTVTVSLSEHQVKALANACVNDENFKPCVTDMIGFFDKVTGYVQQPIKPKGTKPKRQPFDNGIFASLNEATTI